MTRRARWVSAALVLLATSAAHADPAPMTRQQILDLGKTVVGYSYWWGHGAWQPGGMDWGSCSGNCGNCTHSGSWGADCSGFVAKAWQVPSPIDLAKDAHPYSTVDFRNATTHWDVVDRGSVLPADAMVHNENGAGHVFLYESGDGWGSMWAYECKGCSYGCVHDLRTAGSTYIAIRRRPIDDGPPPTPPLDAMFVGQGSDRMADPDGMAQYEACAGSTIKFWFEVANTGSASWVDWDDTAPGNWGHAVRLGVPDDTLDPFTGVSRISLNANANDDVHPPSWSPPGGDCNDQPTCQRTVFAKDGGVVGTAPSTPGIYTTKWKLVDENRGWFGPDMWLSFHVVDCAPPPSGGAGGTGGAPGSSGTGGAPATGGALGKSGSAGATSHGGIYGAAGTPASKPPGASASAGAPLTTADEGDEGDPGSPAALVSVRGTEQESGACGVGGRGSSRKGLALALLVLGAALLRKSGQRAPQNDGE